MASRTGAESAAVNAVAHASPGQRASVAQVVGLSQRYGKTLALDSVTLDFPAGCMVGLIGPDGVGKSSLLSLLAGARQVQEGTVHALGGDMARRSHRNSVCPRIAYMPQGLGKNLYPTLSVEENLQFFGSLFGHTSAERRRRIDDLTRSTGLLPFLDRPVGKLSGGMKQKLGLCCALIHDPDLLILDEPTTGVDPLSRSQFWDLIDRIRSERSGMSVIVATAYMEEANRFDWLVTMDEGRVLATGTPEELRAHTGTESLEAAFIALLPEEKRREHHAVVVPPFDDAGAEDIAIEAQGLTMRFGDFVAVDNVAFRIRRGEIFGFLGSNGCGKTTTMKMLTGLLPASEGQAWLFGQEVDPHDIASRRRVGYMSQGFSLYTELSVEQNLVLHARLFHVPESQIVERVDEMLRRFGLSKERRELPDNLPLGLRQRLSLAVAMVHKPELLILDEPTSGVDPIARDAFWQMMIDLARKDGVTIFISTHFMNEAERCDRISLMHAGKVLVSGAPADLVRERGAQTLEETFIGYLQEASDEPVEPESRAADAPMTKDATDHKKRGWFSWRRALSYTKRETLELQRDPLRATLATVGSLILMFIMGYGITMDINELPYAVIDRDQTVLSQDYTLSLSGSRYFLERPPIVDYADLDRRMRSGELSLALEIPAGFARDVARRKPVQIGAWIDGAMPTRATTVQGYVSGMHAGWLADQAARQMGQKLAFSPVSVETRFRYNPDVKSLPAMVPAVIPMLLMMIPAMLAALSVVREKELGSITNFYATPLSRLEFLLGKQLPYVALSLLNLALLVALNRWLFGVPFKGSAATLALGGLLYVLACTSLGLLISSFTRTQIAAILGTMIITTLPTIQFSGLIVPRSSLDGGAALMGNLFPAGYFLDIAVGTFTKALGLAELWPQCLALLGFFLTFSLLSVALLKKQET